MFNKINISIDDITPHPESSLEVLDRCYELIEIFPDIKFTLFMPMAYYRTMPLPSKSMCEKPLYIDLFPDFCKRILFLSDKNFEIGYHGYYHGIPGKTNNDEFSILSYDDAISKFQLMFDVLEKSKLEGKIKPIFRPPAWRMSPGSILAARDFGIEVLALNSESEYLSYYKDEQNKKKDVVYATCYPPFKELILSKKTEIVYHACTWDKNYLSKELTESLIRFLDSSSDFEFSFIGDMV